MEQPLILLTAGLEPTQKQIPQLHLYQNYAEAVVQAGGLAVLVCSGQRESLAELSQRAQGLFLTGGEDLDPQRYGQKNTGLCSPPDLWRDSLEWSLCWQFVRQKKPVFGVCRGMQMINVFFGGTLTQDLQEDRGLAHPYHSIHSVECIEGSQLEQLFGASFLVNSYHHQAVQTLGAGYQLEQLFGSSFLVNSYHHQAVQALGTGLISTAAAQGGEIVEALEHKTLPVLGVQWHPERMTGDQRMDREGPDMGCLFQRFVQLCSSQ